jgi:hypothetical protein
MKSDLFSAGFSILLAAVSIIAANSIAVECYDKNPDFKASKQSNYGFSIMNIVFAVVFALLAVYSMIIAWRQ